MSAYGRVIEALQQHGSKGRGTAWQCVAHEDRAPSLSVTNGNKGVLINCHAGCATEDVVDALGLSMPDLFDEAQEKRERPRVVAEYPYCDEQGELLMTVKRMEPGYDGERKTFRQYRPDGTPGVKGIRRVLYRLPDVLRQAQAGEIVVVVEGEKDVESLAAKGVIATCNVGGAGKWSDDYTAALRGAKEVVVIADRDEPGRKHAATVADSVKRAGIPVRVLEPARGKDMTDHITAGLNFDDLVAQETHPTNPRNADGAHDLDPDSHSGISGTRIPETDWDEPIPVEARPLPPFPTGHLGKLGEFVQAAAASLQVPEDLMAFSCLAVVSTATGGRLRVNVKADWRESTALYLAALADSSEKKTPTLNLAAYPLREAEAQLIEAARPGIEAKAQEIRITQGRMSKAEQKATGDKPDDALADAEAAREKLLELGDPPDLPRILIRDATLEAIGKVMYGQGGRIGILASEGGLLKVAAGLYGSGGQANTDLLLEAYSGGPYSIDRTGRASARMASTFLAIGLIVQPGILAGIEKKNPEFRENGLLGRFLYSRPTPTGSDTFDSPGIPQDVYEHYDQRIRYLVADYWGPTDFRTMTLSPGALELFAAYYDNFARRRMPGGDLHDIADWAGKFRGQLIRLAAILTVYEDRKAAQISRDTMADVLAMAPYFIAHAKAVFDLMGANSDGRLTPLRDLVTWLRNRSKPSHEFSARDAWQALKGRRWASDMDDMTDALNELEDYGWISLIQIPEIPGKRGRKPSPKYDVHPWIYDPPEEAA
ncbi:DUF3987 domain-containing protein [Streptomyces mesophilus]|uniref:DUF3987 domain-containing protein n=1 Tax=Streptomyces mesophilus TaxID=1775132 RepID=UPI003330760E